MQGRVIPSRNEEQHERSLVLIATKGVVQLFNTVSDFQTTTKKEILKEEKQKNIRYAEMIQKTGENQYNNTSNKAIIEKLQNKQSKWKVLDPENDDESEIDSDGNIKIKDFSD